MNEDNGIHWTLELSVSHAVIDTQHQQLISYFALLQDSILDNDLARTQAVLDEFIAYTHMHFAEEEALMEKYRYPQLVEHEIRHESLLEEIAQLKRNIDAGKTPVSLALLVFLRVWLFEHIKTADRRLGRFLHEQTLAEGGL